MFSLFKKKWTVERLERLLRSEPMFREFVSNGAGALIMADDGEPTGFVQVTADGQGAEVFFTLDCPARNAALLTQFLMNNMPTKIANAYITASYESIPDSGEMH